MGLPPAVGYVHKHVCIYEHIYIYIHEKCIAEAVCLIDVIQKFQDLSFLLHPPSSLLPSPSSLLLPPSFLLPPPLSLLPLPFSLLLTSPSSLHITQQKIGQVRSKNPSQICKFGSQNPSSWRLNSSTIGPKRPLGGANSVYSCWG